MIRALVISVDYSDILNLTLPYNKSFVDETLVVTSPGDTSTVEVAKRHGATTHITDAFYRRRAYFNKAAAIEEGLDVLGRSGWILLLDADILIPEGRHRFEPTTGRVYTARRRILKRLPQTVPPETQWRENKLMLNNEEYGGCFQLFHASDPVLGRPPWHNVGWLWAGGSGITINERWPLPMQARPPFEVLHLGEPFRNWVGRVTKYIDGTQHPDHQDRASRMVSLLQSRRRSTKSGRFLEGAVHE